MFAAEHSTHNDNKNQFNILSEIFFLSKRFNKLSNMLLEFNHHWAFTN